MGDKDSMSTGEGATFSVGYSSFKLEQSGADNQSNNGTAKTKLIEVDSSYDLGGGTTLKAGIDKQDIQLHSDDSATKVDKGYITTLEAVMLFPSST